MTPSQDAGRPSTPAPDDQRASRAGELEQRLTVREQRELLDREYGRMATPDYPDTLEDLSAGIKAHLQHHHGRI